MRRLKKLTKQTFQSLKVRNYRLYFIGQAISLCGTWMQTIAQDWLVLKITDSGTQLGLVTALQFLPILLLGPYGGVVADRIKKRRLLFMTQIAAAILALVLGLLVYFGTVQIWMIYILATLLGLVNAFDNPARQTFAPELVGPELMQNAVSLNSTEVNLARAVGPAIGGALIAGVGLAWCFLINAFSYIPVIICLAMMRDNELYLTKRAARAKGQIKEGFRYVKSKPILLYTLIMMAIVGTFAYEFSVILPLFAQNTFGGNAASYAMLITATGIGSMAGGLLIAGNKRGTPKKMVLSVFFFGLSFLITAFMPTLWLAVIMMGFVGFFSIYFISLGNTTLQMESAPEMRGRVLSLWVIAFLGSTPIGGPIIGFIGEHAGPRWGIAVGGVAAIVAAAIGARTLLRHHKKIDAAAAKTAHS